MQMKILLGAVAVLLVGVVGFFVWNTFMATDEEPQVPVTQEPVVQEPVLSTYASSTLGFSISYPQGYAVNDAYALPFGTSKVINGVKFTIPATTATGTNLSADSGVSVEWLPRAQTCSGDIYLLDDVRATMLSEGSTQYSVATSSGAGAGNFYEEMVFALSSSTPCTAVRYSVHSTQVANYEPGTIREFDRAALLAEFDAIRRSLQLQAVQ